MDDHEWEIDIIEGSVFRNTPDGIEFMPPDEMQRRINATERLIVAMKKPATRTRKTTMQMCKLLDGWIDILEKSA